MHPAPRRSALHGLACAAALLELLGGCATKAPPDRAALQRDAFGNLVVPQAWASEDGSSASRAVATGWMAGFNDPMLDALVVEALAHNVDLRLAATRVDMATAHLRAAGAALYRGRVRYGREGAWAQASAADYAFAPVDRGAGRPQLDARDRGPAAAHVEAALAGIANATSRESANRRALELANTRLRIGSADERQVQEQQRSRRSPRCFACRPNSGCSA